MIEKWATAVTFRIGLVTFRIGANTKTVTFRIDSATEQWVDRSLDMGCRGLFYGPLLWDAVLGVLAKVSIHGISAIQQPAAAPEALAGAGWRG